MIIQANGEKVVPKYLIFLMQENVETPYSHGNMKIAQFQNDWQTYVRHLFGLWGIRWLNVNFLKIDILHQLCTTYRCSALRSLLILKNYSILLYRYWRSTFYWILISDSFCLPKTDMIFSLGVHLDISVSKIRSYLGLWSITSRV